MKDEPLLESDFSELRKELMELKLKQLKQQGLNPKEVRQAILEDAELAELNRYQLEVMQLSPQVRMTIPKSELGRFKIQ